MLSVSYHHLVKWVVYSLFINVYVCLWMYVCVYIYICIIYIPINYASTYHLSTFSFIHSINLSIFLSSFSFCYFNHFNLMTRYKTYICVYICVYIYTLFIYTYKRRRQWYPTPVLLNGSRSLVGCGPWGC